MKGKWIYRVSIRIILAAICFCCLDSSYAYGQQKHSVTENIAIGAQSRFFVKTIVIEGNTALSAAELAEFTNRYENRDVTFEDLQNLRHELTSYYVKKGYVSSGVVIPDQELTGGVVTMKVIEGSLKDISIEGNRHFREWYLRDRIALGVGTPLNVYELQQALQLLQQDPRIRKINTELAPGVQTGEALLKVRVEEERPYHFSLGIANNQAPSIGSTRGEASVTHLNLTGRGDVVDLRYGLSNGNNDFSFSYSLPLTQWDTMLSAYYRRNSAMVIEDQFDKLDIVSKFTTAGVSLRQPLYKTVSEELALSLACEKKLNRTYLLGRKFSFTELEDSVTRLTAIRFVQDWTKRDSNYVLAFRSNFSFGIDAFNSTLNDTIADSRFFSWLGQAQWLWRYTDSGQQLVFRTSAQLTADHLMPAEQFTVGGMNTVRGYKENQLVRDNGLVSSLELRFPVFSYKQTLVQLAPFVDFGWAWNKDRTTPYPRTVSSFGAGVLWTVIKGMQLNVYYGEPMRRRLNDGSDLQDKGVHFQFAWQVF